MFINTTYRSTEVEIMDNFLMEGEMLRESLDKIAAVNRRLGGNNVTINGLKKLLVNEPKGATISIIDLGCGSGDMLRTVADFGRKHKYNFKLTGIDANEYTINYARKISSAYPEITYMKMNVLADEFLSVNFDIALATLFLHHFSTEEIESLLKVITKKANKGVIVNDLHRSWAAFYLFKLISLFISNPMVRKDGAVSVLRAFKKNELISIGKKLQDTVSTIRWKWAFRYQWIIKNK
jgi:2-polyprenyl-3-methyl-5-hydroxy-6-metoxy-1,4-benzoquinol methylase